MSSKSKLCFIIPEYNRETSTHFSYLYDFIEKISEEFDIFLIAERGMGMPPKNVAHFYIQKFSWPALRILENELAIEWARVLGYKTFYIHYSFLSAYNALWVTRFSGGKVFYWNCGEPWKYKRNFLRNFFERVVYKLIHYLVIGTEGLKQRYAEYYNLPLEKIKVMPNYVDISKIFRSVADVRIDLKMTLKIAPRAKVILFVHRLSQRKGAHYLPKILKELNDENSVLLVVGDGPERKALKLQITNYKLQDRVRFLGWIPQNDLARYYSVADVFIMPSDEEGFPHVLLESMAYGIPFVAFDVGGVKEIVPNEMSPYVVPSGNVKLFAEKIKELLSATDKDKDVLVLAMQNHVSRYDINSAARFFAEIIIF